SHLLTDQHERLTDREIAPRADPGGLQGKRKREETIEPCGNGLDSAGRHLSGERLPNAKLRQRDGHQECIRISTPMHADTRSGKHSNQAPPCEPLALEGELRMAAVKNVERRNADHQKASGGENASQFARGIMFLSALEVYDHVKRHDQVE